METVFVKSNLAGIFLFNMQGIRIQSNIAKQIDSATKNFSGKVIHK